MCEDTAGKDCLVSFLKAKRASQAIFVIPRASDFLLELHPFGSQAGVLQQDFQSAEIRILSHHLRPTESETLEYLNLGFKHLQENIIGTLKLKKRYSRAFVKMQSLTL